MKWVFAVYSAIVVAVVVHVLRRKRVPSVAAAWALTVILFPVAGMLLYLLAGYRRREGQARPEQDRRGRRPLETLLLRECGSEPTLNNRISLLHNGNNAFSALIASLQMCIRDRSQLGDIVFVDVPTVGETLAAGDVFGTIEAVKTVSDAFIPVGGEVLEFNSAVDADPAVVNKDPYGEGWIIKVRFTEPADFEALLSAEQYKELIG